VKVSGNDAVRVLEVAEGAELTLKDLTIADGAVLGRDRVSGGGIHSEGTLTLTNSTIEDNEVRSGDDVFGGGIANYGPITVTDSIISDNTLQAINGSYSRGAGIWNAGPLTVKDSVISGNHADYVGGGIELWSDTLTLSNTILTDSPSGGNCHSEYGYGQLTDGGYNIEDGSSCGFSEGMGSLSNTDLLFDPADLADNGGPTKTIALLPQSPAVDLIGGNACPPLATDQRGIERPQGEACDSGPTSLCGDHRPRPSARTVATRTSASRIRASA
jgi:fibronectin-binding autotransporter adhesin